MSLCRCFGREESGDGDHTTSLTNQMSGIVKCKGEVAYEDEDVEEDALVEERLYEDLDDPLEQVALFRCT